MTEARVVTVSKYLAKHLRHSPERLGLTLEKGGWVGVEELLAATARNRMSISRDDLEFVVQNNSKKRFAFDETGTKIRANQGHSVEVDLELVPTEPPAVLYHGTGHKTAHIIEAAGLCKMNRHHVHLSADKETAVNVGARHGRPVVFVVDAQKMAAEGFLFYRSENGVWLTDEVPPQFLHALPDK